MPDRSYIFDASGGRKRIEDGEIFSEEILEQIKKKYENTNYNTSNSPKNSGDRMRLPEDFSGLKGIIKK